MTNDPYRNEGQVRHRRSERHSRAVPDRQEELQPAYHRDDAAPLPLGSETAGIPQAPRPQPVPRPGQQPLPPRPLGPVSYDDDRFSAPVSSRRDEDDGDEYEDDYPPLWPKFLALALGLLLVIAAGLYFLVPEGSSGILGGLRGGLGGAVNGVKKLVGIAEEKKPQLIKFETPEATGQTGVRTVFTFTADMPVDSVRMVDEVGSEVIGQLAKIDPEGTVWTLSVVFDQPRSGIYRGDVLLKEVWYQGDKTIAFTAYEPTPSPEPTVVATMEPTSTPEVMPTDEPLGSKGGFVVGEAQDTFTDTGDDLTAETSAEPAMEAAATPEPFVVRRQTPEATAAAETPADTGLTAEDQPADEAMDTAAVTADETAPEDTAAADNTAAADDAMVADDTMAAANDTAAQTQDTTAQSEWDQFTQQAASGSQSEWDEPTDGAQTADGAQAADTTKAPGGAGMALLAMEPDEGALPSALKMKEDVYQKGKRVKELSRAASLNMPGPGEYASYEGGVFTFRGDAFRGNAAFGTAEMPLEQMSILWKAPLGSLRTGEGTLWGLGWTSQPAIVKWSVEVRQMMNIVEAKKDVKALKEVIVGAQDGKVYFFDLNDGVATRSPIDMGYPIKGSVAVDTQGRPMLAVGQGISKLANKTGPIGLHLYELIGQKEAMFLNGRKTKQQTQYSTNGAFDGTALFDRNTDTMVVAGENGLLYTVALNTAFDYTENFSLKLNPEITFLKSKTGAQKDMSVSNEASVAMYGRYAYTADRQGIIRAVDTDSMKTQWAFDAGDNTDATPALGFDEDGSLGLYTGTTVFARSRKAGAAVLRRIDAMTGKEVWKKEIIAKYSDDERSGLKASPVVGEKSLKDLVFFTVNRAGDGSAATVYALNKQTGEEVWSFPLNTNTVSSPVAVYNAEGRGYLIQADEKGMLYLLNAQTGEQIYTLDLGASVDGSPAVYNDVLVIGSKDKDNSFLYGIRLE